MNKIRMQGCIDDIVIYTAKIEQKVTLSFMNKLGDIARLQKYKQHKSKNTKRIGGKIYE